MPKAISWSRLSLDRPPIKRLFRLCDVVKLTGRSRASIYRSMQAGEFPQSIRIGPNSVAWLDFEIAEWLEARIAERDSVEAK